LGWWIYLRDNDNTETVKSYIEREREKLNKLLNLEDDIIQSPKIINVSCRLDKLIVKYLRDRMDL
jgi:Spo0E like sporulation regulatory protein.